MSTILPPAFLPTTELPDNKLQKKGETADAVSPFLLRGASDGRTFRYNAIPSELHEYSGQICSLPSYCIAFMYRIYCMLYVTVTLASILIWPGSICMLSAASADAMAIVFPLTVGSYCAEVS